MHEEHLGLLCRKAFQVHESTFCTKCHLFPINHVCPKDLIHPFIKPGSWHQGPNPHPCHGVPLWGGHDGHQTGVPKGLWKVSVHSHLCKSHWSQLVSFFFFFFLIADTFCCLSGWYFWGLQEAAAEAVWWKWLDRLTSYFS